MCIQVPVRPVPVRAHGAKLGRGGVASWDSSPQVPCSTVCISAAMCSTIRCVFLTVAAIVGVWPLPLAHAHLHGNNLKAIVYVSVDSPPIRW